MKELVVAVYRENIDWLNSIDVFDKVVIYNKGNRVISENINPPNAFLRWENLLNVGREAHTILHHITTQYYNLADFTVFLQGHPFDGMQGVTASNIGQKFANHFFNENIYEPAFWPANQLIHDNTDLCKKCYVELFEENSPEIYFSPGAQWIVPKTYILSKSLKFYKNLLREVSVHHSHHRDGIINPWTIEGMWNFIFNKTTKPKIQ